MSKQCETVVFTDKAYNAIIRESFAKHPVETGGILLGYVTDEGIWIVMEMVPPGINAIFEPAYFEYDTDFVNYLGASLAYQYAKPLQVLGLWHRHPGSMDYFSSTDDTTNRQFASKTPFGTISGLVNIDPRFRMTLYHLSNEAARHGRISYSTVDVEVGDDLIPDEYFSLRYVDPKRSELNPNLPEEAAGRHGPSPAIDRQNRHAEEESVAYIQKNATPASVKPKSTWRISSLCVAAALAAGYLLGNTLPLPAKTDKVEKTEKTGKTETDADDDTSGESEESENHKSNNDRSE